MSYDSWKTTDPDPGRDGDRPDDGPEPQDEGPEISGPYEDLSEPDPDEPPF